MGNDEAHCVAAGRTVRLGRAAKSVPPTFKLADLLTTDLPKPRRTVGHATGLDDFRMCGNDRLGDCVCAAVEHHTHIWGWRDKKGVDQTEVDQRAVDLYWATGDQDNGRNIANVYSHVRHNGYAGRKDAVVAYMAVDPRNIEQVCTAIDLFGGINIGVNLPESAQQQRKLWDVVGDPSTDPASQPGSWGGHSVIIPGYNRLRADNRSIAGWFPLITWGFRMYMTQRFWDTYVDEALVAVSGECLDALGKSPRGFDLAKLEGWLAAL